jgi:hypothetical protein
MEIAVLALIMVIAIGVPIAMRLMPVKNLFTASVKTDAPANPYHCVGIHHLDGACAAVERLSGRRFLSKDAPSLPLLTCDAAECRCRYMHFDDRRQGPERRNLRPALQDVREYSGQERRSGRERRQFIGGDIGAGAIRQN